MWSDEDHQGMTDKQQHSYIVPNSPKINISHKENGYKKSVSLVSYDDDKDCGGEATFA